MNKKIIAIMLLILFLISTISTNIYAKNLKYVNEKNNYKVIIADEADLLDESEEIKLAETMKQITAYGNVVFKTIDENNTTVLQYASKYYYQNLGTSSGTIFLIDMDNREICIFSDGNINKFVTEDKANIITDNAYKYAMNGNYFECAQKAYSEIFDVLEGRRINQSMKYISNTILAMIISCILNFLYIINNSRIRKVSYDKMLLGVKSSLNMTKPEVTFIRKYKVYIPPSNDYDSGSSHSSRGGSSSGGGHSSGGGSSGSGGSHRF